MKLGKMTEIRAKKKNPGKRGFSKKLPNQDSNLD